MAKVALIGDFNPDVVAHRVIPQALDLAAKQVGVSVTWDWVGTNTITDAPRQLAGHGGIWCVPGSPYRSMDGALAAIRFARETRRPFLGTCGGFQHVLVETARNVLGISNADHAETAPAISALPAVSRVEPSKSTEGGRVERPPLVVTPLACSLVGRQDDIAFTPGSHLHAIFHGQSSQEGYHCNYGPNPDYRARFEAAGLRFTGFDADGQIRACELPGHPFFIGTLFQPERSALGGRHHPLIEAFVAQLS